MKQQRYHTKLLKRRSKAYTKEQGQERQEFEERERQIVNTIECKTKDKY